MTWQEAVQNPTGYCYRILPDQSTLIRGIDGETHYYPNVFLRTIDSPDPKLYDEGDWAPCEGGERFSAIETKIEEIGEIISADGSLLDSVLENLEAEVIKLREQLGGH